MDRRALMEVESGELVRDRPKLSWRDGVNVALDGSGMTLEVAR